MFKSCFPKKTVEYFINCFDYYHSEASIPRTVTFIEKDFSINAGIERLRLSTMSSLFARRDVIVVASVSCSYGTGSKEDYKAVVIAIHTGQTISREQYLSRRVDLQDTRNDRTFERGRFRVRGDSMELCPAGREDALRVELFGDQTIRGASEKQSLINNSAGARPHSPSAIATAAGSLTAPCVAVRSGATPRRSVLGALL